MTRLMTWCGWALTDLSAAGAAAVRRRDDALPRGLSSLLIHLGPAFIKGGQLLSTRTDLLPPSWCAALGRLHDRVEPMTPAQRKRALQAAYTSGAWPFAELDEAVVGSGSIACVYRGRLHDGRPVAVKVRRPGISRRMHADLRLLAAGAGLGQRVPGLRRVPMRRMVDQVGAAVLHQLDLAGEGEALGRLRTNLDGLIRVPAPMAGASGDGVLVMEYVEGLERFGPEEFGREQRRAIVRRVLQGVYRMLFIDGLVHCDMHPGNLYLTRDGEAVLLDAGFVVRLSPPVKRLFAEFFLDLSTGRADACADVVLRSAEHVPAGSDLDAFRRGIRELVLSSHRRTAGQFRLAPFAARLFDLQRRSGISAAPEFVFPLLSLLVLEGMINNFDVDVDFQAEAIPTLLQALRR
jgi:ubiquinone biosynthesis protein